MTAPLWMPRLAVLPRATLPELGADVPLSDWRKLRFDAGDTALMIRLYQAMAIEDPQIRVYWETATGLRVFATIDPTTRFGALLHVSLSYAKHDPTWEEIKLVKQAFFGPHRDAIQILPRDQDWVNVHPHTFHLSEAPERWGQL